MTSDNADSRDMHRYVHLSVDEVARAEGISTAKTLEDLATDDIFQTDEELDDFLSFVREQRSANLV